MKWKLGIDKNHGKDSNGDSGKKAEEKLKVLAVVFHTFLAWCGLMCIGKRLVGDGVEGGAVSSVHVKQSKFRKTHRRFSEIAGSGDAWFVMLRDEPLDGKTYRLPVWYRVKEQSDDPREP